ncbi:leukocyte-associated immunoglobulin-like receptor 2 [Diceros bicornis minor]|uniref:leukocyte-associated immunoglobulin-like receptor 2 n=1 Tax=Diceros bicornis minor TaxID=77932 RepID=UPI0026EE34FA|nr:leukocyte-associated immunoglobulin-like receptor 2 [Diceros bicornis minor]
MSPNLTFLLGLGLCLDQVILTREGALPRPSISAKSGSVIPGAWPVTIICQGPAAAETFRLEKDRKSYRDQRNVSQLGPHETEARFHITAVSDDTARGYCCRYFKRSTWSECSEVLELKVTEEDVSALPSEAPGEVSPPPTEAGSQTAATSSNYMVVNSVRMGLAGVILLILVVILAEAWHSQHRFQHGPQGWIQEGAHQRD